MNGKGRPLPRRLCTLEEAARERAAREVRRALGRLDDEVLALFVSGHGKEDPSEEEQAAEAEVHAVFDEIEDLAALAVDEGEEASEDERALRMHALLEPFIDTRRPGVLRAFRRLELVGEGGESSRISTNTGGTE